ncbi:RNA polymerase sigma factor [Rubritalea spongiae]|uniref:RNA polymerase sigma factor n=1 Tax=Rubritalea spongiae TaxID=430797 RepID=A0ABW5E059_9BACT
MSHSSQNTRYSLLRRAIDLNDDHAWNELNKHYERFIYYILHQLNVSSSDIDDLAQQTLIILMRDLPKYDRERARFRTWLKQVIRSTALMHFRQRESQQVKMNKFAGDAQLSQQDQTTDIDQYIEEEWETYVTNVAMKRVRKEYRGQAIEVFELGLQGISAQQIAQRTGLTISSVYTLRKRVKRSLFLEVQAVIHELEG